MFFAAMPESGQPKCRLLRYRIHSPLALKDFGVENARDLLGLLLQLEDEFGIVPAEDGSGLSIDASAEKAPKTTQMLKAWAAKRNELESGEITPEEYADWKAKF